MSIIFDNPPPAIGCGDPGDPIDFACLFDGSQALERLFSAGDTTCWTYSAWAKNTDIDTIGPSALSFLSVLPLSGSTSANGTFFSYMATRSPLGFYIRNAAIVGGYNYMEVARAWRDPSAYAHVCLSHDAGLPLGDRYKLSFGGLHLPGVYNGGGGEFNRAVRHAIGGHIPLNGGAVYPSAKAYLADIHFVDGLALGAENFGYFNSHGVWVPKKYDGPYGSNGFHLDFADPLNLGKDVSGNGNHFTATGLTADNQVTDTPTNMKSTSNPSFPPIAGNNTGVLSFTSGGRRVESSTQFTGIVPQTTLVPTEGKWVSRTKVEFITGVAGVSAVIEEGAADFTDNVVYLETNGTIYVNNVMAQSGLGAIVAGDVVDTFVDPQTRQVFFHLNGVQFGSPTFITGTGRLLFAYPDAQNTGGSIQQLTDVAPTADYYPLTSAYLPCPAILNPDDYFMHRIKTGGASVSDLPFNPTVGKALVMSARMDTSDPCLISTTVNGAGMAWDASTNLTGLAARPNGITAFNANGYSIGTDTAYQGSRLDLIWRASPKAGFDIVTINHTTGTATTVPHFAGGVIEYAWCLPHSGGQPKRIFHHRLGNDRYFPMAEQGPSVSDPGWISSTANTVTLDASMPSGTYTLPVWRSVAQFSSFGRYAPNDSADGPFIPLDFSPRLFLPSGNGPNGMRAIFVDDLVVNGGNDQRLALEAAAVSQTAYEYCDFLSNGVKARGVYTPINYSDTDFYYTAAFARTPGKFARAR